MLAGPGGQRLSPLLTERPAAFHGRRAARGALPTAPRQTDNFGVMATPRSPRQLPKRRAGFTIIELMLVVAVAGVLALVAYPTFIESVRKGRRAEAVAALAQVQQAQERWRANKSAYTAVLANLNLDLKPGNKTRSGYYTVSIEDVGGSKYTATAQAVAGTSQSHDTNCTTMRVKLKDSRIEYGGCNGCALPADDAQLTDPDRCWSR